jgi:hypothetical protein
MGMEKRLKINNLASGVAAVEREVACGPNAGAAVELSSRAVGPFGNG